MKKGGNYFLLFCEFYRVFILENLYKNGKMKENDVKHVSESVHVEILRM